MDTLGRPIPNIAILGAFVKVTGILTLEKLKEAVKEEMSGSHPEAIEGNIKACELCYNMVDYGGKVESEGRRQGRLQATDTFEPEAAVHAGR
jgi:Pyruvate/2-oxoacid:ferredoxin oxidoreductase gamma subunit